MFSPSQTLSHYSRGNAIIWLSLAFQAGSINAGALLACHKFVSHTTGFATVFGSEVGQGRWMTGLSILSIPIFFLIGTMIAAFFIDRRIQKDLRPLYPVVMGLLFSLLLWVTSAGVEGYFGVFGADLDLTTDYAMLAALAMACGLQNATITSSFGAIVRTTHLTGLTTDLGIGLMRVLTRSHRLNTRSNEIRANTMRLGIIMAFSMGAFISTLFYIQLQYLGFMVPTVIALAVFIWSVFRFFNSQNYIKAEHLQNYVEIKRAR